MTSGFIGIALNFIRSSFKQQKSGKSSLAKAGQPHSDGWRVRFEESGRSGRVGFEGEGRSFGMYWEFGGADVLAIIDVPTVEKWEAQTGIPLEKRAEILDFIGRETVRQKISSRGYAEIKESCILIHA